MDSKGKSITIAKIPFKNKKIIRENYTFSNDFKIKVFGVEYEYGIHSEVFIVYSILSNPKFIASIRDNKKLELINIRKSKAGNNGISSKPCDKCVKMLKNFKKNIFNNEIDIFIKYFEKNEEKILKI